MIYKFKSKAAGDVIMLGPHGDALLCLLGREPAAKGIIEPADQAGAIERLNAALAAAEQAGLGEQAIKSTQGSANAAGDDEDPVSLRRRLWPMMELLRAALAAGVPVVWGV